METTSRIRVKTVGGKVYFELSVPPWFPVEAGDIVKVSTMD